MKLEFEGIKFKVQVLIDIFYKILSYYDSKFMLGFIGGFMALSTVIYRVNGFNYTITSFGNVHLTTLDLLASLIPISYYFLKREKNNGKRVFLSVCFPVFVFFIHDIFWSVEAWQIGTILTNMGFMQISFYKFFEYVMRNICYAGLSFFFIGHYFKISKTFLVLFIFQVLFHTALILVGFNDLSNGLVLLCVEIIDSLPYIALLKE